MQQGREVCLVTGGAGFIGSHLVARLLATGQGVVVLDDFSTGRQKQVPPAAALFPMRLDARSDLRGLDRFGITSICHLGGQSSGESSFLDPARDLESNVGGTLSLLRWARANGIQRFQYASSVGVYGEQAGAVKEEAPCRPMSFYGASKLAAEGYVRLFGEQGLPFTIFRMFNVYGPGQDLSNTRHGMAGIYLSYVLRRAPIDVKGSLDRIRDLVYVGDVVEAWAKALMTPQAAGKTFNVASGTPTRVGDLIQLLLKVCVGHSNTYPVRELPPTPGDVRGFWADLGEIRSVLDWSPRVSLEEGLRRMVGGYVDKAEEMVA